MPVITCGGTTLNYHETPRGTNRSLTVSRPQSACDKREYMIKPNPHNQPEYNKDQPKFYRQLACGLAAQVTPTGAWPDEVTVYVELTGTTYTLTPR